MSRLPGRAAGGKRTTLRVGGDPPAGALLNRAPAVHLAAATQHVSAVEKDVAEDLVHQIVHGMWPTAYEAALDVAEGKRKFCRDFRTMFSRVAKPHPLICGRIDPSRFAELAWAIGKHLVECYALGTWGVRVEASRHLARKVIRDWERHYVAPKVMMPVDQEQVTIEGMDGTSITGDEFISSGNKRTGTLHEITEDLADEEARNFSHRRIEELAAETKKDA